jgi:16S rRNA (uracil1498-N3)-methyltransferase
MAERYYVNSPLQVGPVELVGPEAHHLSTVCRIRQGSLVYLFNGDGNQYPAKVVEVSRRHVSLAIDRIEYVDCELPGRLEVASPLPKGDRAHFLIEKLTEIGVTKFVPLRTARSIVDPRETKLEKLQHAVIEASKQCGRNRLMQIERVMDWQVYDREVEPFSLRVLAHPGKLQHPSEGRLDQLLAKAKLESLTKIAIAVGPEGGFTDEEVKEAIAIGWQPVDLGPRILRVETAAIVLAAHTALRISNR